ncbi:MAG: autotransporter outer membrane beta-barrel domain-containing protein [Desulfobacula sp.]|nr:autotransporter outer membrane beta-barrel domain-containing protein [Desulfobacula sp.]
MKETLRNLLLTSFCFFVLSTVAFADGTRSTLPKHSFGIGLEYMYFDYEEENGDFMEEDGPMYGVIIDYTYHGDDNLMFKFSLEYAADDDVEYDGGYQDGTPLKADTDTWLVESRVLFGSDISNPSSETIITPFIGIAYRYWNDDLQAIGGYERETEYWYTPIGVKTVSPLFGKWTWGINAEYDLFWGGKVKGHLSDVHPAYNDPEVDQDGGDGYGVRFSLQFKREITKGCALSIEPYIRYWDIDESERVTLTDDGFPYATVFEPENETTTFGLRLRLVF